MNKIWKKNCPKCGENQFYGCKSSLTNAIKKNKICNVCRSKLKRTHQTEILEKNCPRCNINQKYIDRKVFNRAIKGDWLCRKCSTKEISKLIDRSFQKTEEYRKMMSNIKMGHDVSENTKKKLRIAKLKQIELLGTQINYNPKACKFIDEYGEQNGYNFQHALNGGEIKICGYSLDGYDKENKIVFEYDEPKHNIPSISQKDKIREEQIIKEIQPKMFIRYNEEYNKIVDVISGKEWI